MSRRRKRRPTWQNVLLSAAITLVILGIAAGVTIAVQSATDTYVGRALGVLIGMIAVLILMPIAYPPGERQWWRWIGYVVLVWLAFLAWIPLILLPWLAVTKKHWIWEDGESRQVSCWPHPGRAPLLVAHRDESPRRWHARDPPSAR